MILLRRPWSVYNVNARQTERGGEKTGTEKLKRSGDGDGDRTDMRWGADVARVRLEN